MLRLSLIIAILAGLGALYFVHFNVSDRITTLQTDLADTQDRERQAQADRQEAIAEKQTAEEELDTAQKNLSEASTQLEAATRSLEEQRTRANELSENLSQVTAERNTAQQKLSRWELLDVEPEQVDELLAQLDEARQERDAYSSENEILSRRIDQLEARLTRYEGEKKVDLPKQLKGSVVAVDPKWDFVVLDIGEKQGVLENGELLVNRNGRLIAKLQVTKVHPDRSIANILPDWQRDEIVEGDRVLVY